MNNVLILDCETTGLYVDSDSVIEFAAILYSVKHKTILQQVSTLLNTKGENKAEHINKIPAAAAMEAMPSSCAIDLISGMAAHANAVIAHNAEFDKGWVNLFAPLRKLLELPWICSYQDIEWPNSKAANLVTLALEFGVPVVSAHRALTDCTLLANIFSKTENLAQLLTDAKNEKSTYIAHVGFENKELAKSNGFVWSPNRGAWIKKMSDNKVSKLPFQVSKIG